MKTKTYYLIGILVFIIALIGYHFVAANQAEQQITKALQEYDEQEETISINYSDITITPFSADITIEDLAIIFGNHIERGKKLILDLGYWDFLNIYFGGAEYGLKQLEHAVITVATPSYTNRTDRNEIKSDSLTIAYRGNVLDGLRNAINQIPFQSNHSLEINSKNTTISLPNTFLIKATAKQLHYTGTISGSKTNFWTNGTHNIRLNSLVWTPPSSFQDRYSFFIKGFGYNTDAIPFEYAELNSQPATTGDTLNISTELKSELALFSVDGSIKNEQPFTKAQLYNTRLSLSQFSEQFANMLTNIERLLNISLPNKNGTITINLTGTILNPQIEE
ncbi:hypothetical protein [Fodinibius sp. Rm-B-1B1-1]|uniref:hypothetical protein n=1 Tax=Fodinibius alkaliphilus TaxID=3140241 RepID=UPI00315A02E9